MVADVNLIDFESLDLRHPELVADLPGGASRLIQRCDGYVSTIKSGREILRNGETTGYLPGELIRGMR